MSADHFRFVYGPVPSRRLGRSLGIDPIPFKLCTYDCVYCQLGRTTKKTITRGPYVPVADVLEEVKRKLAAGVKPDYITLAGSGEPTLNSGIGAVIRGLKSLSDIPVAVITNGSLLWDPEVRDALQAADLVIPSLDAGDERLFRRINRPQTGISFDRMVDGLAEFTAQFPGRVWLEVFLLAGVNGIPAEVQKIAALAQRIAPDRIQLNTVLRPPAEKTARPLSPLQMRALSLIFPRGADIIQPDGDAGPQSPGESGATDDDIIGILRRHPGTFQDVADSLGIHPTEALKRLDALASAGKTKPILLEDRTYYTVAEPGTVGDSDS
jgi:wyosine [tRNA(Phe)-imidazoG37] synthetase (radical SAM superfamily)